MFRWIRTKIWPRVQRTLTLWQQDDGALMAASMAYYALLSFFPLLLILISVVGFVLHFSSGAQDAQRQLLDLLAQNTSPLVSKNVGLLLTEVRVNAGLGGPLGAAALLVAAIGIFTQLEHAFDRIWKVRRGGARGVRAAILNALVHRLRAFLMLLSVGLLVIAALIGSTAVSAMRSLTADLPRGPLLWSMAEIVLSIWVNWILFTLIYKTIPRTRVPWSNAAEGAALAAVLWEINRQVLAALVIGDRYSAYGVVGSMIVLLLWVYLASSILFLGAEFIQAIHHDDGKKAAGETAGKAPPKQGD